MTGPNIQFSPGVPIPPPYSITGTLVCISQRFRDVVTNLSPTSEKIIDIRIPFKCNVIAIGVSNSSASGTKFVRCVNSKVPFVINTQVVFRNFNPAGVPFSFFQAKIKFLRFRSISLDVEKSLSRFFLV